MSGTVTIVVEDKPVTVTLSGASGPSAYDLYVLNGGTLSLQDYIASGAGNLTTQLQQAQASAALAGRYANDNTDTDVVGGTTGSRGAKWWATVASAAAAALNLKMKTISTRSGWLHVFTDVNDNIAGGWKPDFSFWTTLTGNIDATIAAIQTRLNLGLPKTISTRSGWLHVFTDSLDSILFGADPYGDFWTQNFNVTKFFRDGGLSTTAKEAIFPTADIAMYMDSLGENYAAFAADLNNAFIAKGYAPRDVYKWGLGGQGSLSILARQGGVPCQVTFPIGTSGFPEIPASGPVNVTVTNAPLNHPGAGNSDTISMTGILQVADGILGTLTRLAGGTQYQFTRTTAVSSATIVSPAIPLMPNNAAMRKRSAVVWPGTNDLSPGVTDALTIFGYQKAYAKAQTSLNKRNVVIMPTWDMATYGSARRARYDELLGYVKSEWPTSYIDLIALLQPLGNGSANDNADIAAGLIPRSLQSGDRLHFPAGGVAYQAIIAEIVNTYIRNGWVNG